jgi:hypothetical protein
MGKQTNLEKIGFDRRDNLPTSDYNAKDPYNANHEDAISNDKPLGKGTGHGGHLHSQPDASKPSTMIDYSNFDTFNGGGSYDIHGRNEIGGRNRLMTYNIYGPNNAYDLNSIDTSENIKAGQVTIK